MNTILRRSVLFSRDAMPYRLALVWGSVLLSGALGGCKNGYRGRMAAEEPGESKPQFPELGDLVDPTGIKTYKRAAKAIEDAFAALDVDEFNAAAQKIRQLTDKISERVAAVPPREIESIIDDLAGSMKAVRAQLDRMQLVEAVNSLRAAIEQINAKVKTLDFERANAVMEEAESLVADIRTEVAKLSESLDRTIDTLGRQLDKAGEKIESLPVQELREDLDALKEAIDSIGKAAESLESSFQRAGTTLLVATVTFVMISLCALAWLVKFVRRRSA